MRIILVPNWMGFCHGHILIETKTDSCLVLVSKCVSARSRSKTSEIGKGGGPRIWNGWGEDGPKIFPVPPSPYLFNGIALTWLIFFQVRGIFPVTYVAWLCHPVATYTHTENMLIPLNESLSVRYSCIQCIVNYSFTFEPDVMTLFNR